MADVRGICPIIAPPFTLAGDVDYDSLRNLLRTLMRGGCHALTLFGIGGEYYKLSDEERHNMLGLVVDECKAGGVPSIISITQHATKLAVWEARHAEERGADCLMILPPFFLQPTAADLLAHMRAIVEAVKIPVILQYVPHLTGVAIEPTLFARLADSVPNTIYCKIECKPPGGYITELLRLSQGRVKVLAGSAGMQLPEALDRGAIGAMPGCSMFEVYLEIYGRYIQGDREEAIRVHNLLLPLLNHILQKTEMIIHYEKRILKRRGIIQTDRCRLPAFTPDEFHDRLFERYFERVSPYLG
jgi:dihydrodipicolinate synthase/N-acetylneuraminate lyase